MRSSRYSSHTLTAYIYGDNCGLAARPHRRSVRARQRLIVSRSSVRLHPPRIHFVSIGVQIRTLDWIWSKLINISGKVPRVLEYLFQSPRQDSEAEMWVTVLGAWQLRYWSVFSRARPKPAGLMRESDQLNRALALPTERGI